MLASRFLCLSVSRLQQIPGHSGLCHWAQNGRQLATYSFFVGSNSLVHQKKFLLWLTHTLVNGRRWIIRRNCHPLQSTLQYTAFPMVLCHVAVVQLRCWLLNDNQPLELCSSWGSHRWEGWRKGENKVWYTSFSTRLWCGVFLTYFWFMVFHHLWRHYHLAFLIHFSLTKAEENRSEGHVLLDLIRMA